MSKSRLSQSLSLSLRIQTSVQSCAAFTKKEKILARSIKIGNQVTLNCSQGIWSSYFRNVVSSCDSLLTWEDGAPFLPQDLPVKLSKHCLVKLTDNVIKFSVVPSLSFLPYYLQFFAINSKRRINFSGLVSRVLYNAVKCLMHPGFQYTIF